MSNKDDTFEMLDDVPEAPKKSFILLIVIFLVMAGGLSFYLLNGSGTDEKLVSTTVEPAPEVDPPVTTQVAPPVSVVINFDEASSVINPDQEAKLLEFYQQISVSAGTLQIDGYTDNSDSNQDGQILSMQRAEAVAAALKSFGSNDKIELVLSGLGENNPVGDNNTVEGRQQNRRVELTFTPSP